MSRRGLLVAIGALVLAGCTGAAGGLGPTASSANRCGGVVRRVLAVSARAGRDGDLPRTGTEPVPGRGDWSRRGPTSPAVPASESSTRCDRSTGSGPRGPHRCWLRPDLAVTRSRWHRRTRPPSGEGGRASARSRSRRVAANVIATGIRPGATTARWTGRSMRHPSTGGREVARLVLARSISRPPATQVPTTWEELMALSDRIVADGKGKPWCGGRNRVRRRAGRQRTGSRRWCWAVSAPEVYDRWVAGGLAVRLAGDPGGDGDPRGGCATPRTSTVGSATSRRWHGRRFQDGGRPILTGECFMFPFPAFYVYEWERSRRT